MVAPLKILATGGTQEVIQIGSNLTKTERTLFDVCSSCRALVISGMDLALRASSYAHSMPLIAITSVITSIEKKKHRFGEPEKQIFLEHIIIRITPLIVVN